MTTTMQSKILTAIEQVASEHKAETVQSRAYSNTGRLYLQDGFITLVEIQYDFQAHSCTLSFAGPGISAHPENESARLRASREEGVAVLKAHMVKYNDGVRLQAILADLGRMLEQARKADS